MSHRRVIPATILFALVPLATLLAQTEGDLEGGHWPEFRGWQATGVAEGFDLPVRWDLEQNENLRWKRPIEGLGLSCPAIWGNRVFITTAISGRKDDELKVGLYGDIQSVEDDSVHVWKLYCIDKPSGEVLWERKVCEAVPRVKRHTKSSHANSTPATDGQRVVFFCGSEGLFCYDVEGKLRWKKDFGKMDSGYFAVPSAQWAFGSSPVIYEGQVFVQCDVLENSFLASFDLEDGSELWRTERDDVPTWSTPTLCTREGQEQVIVNGFRHIGGYDMLSGEPLWWLEGGGDIPVPTPVLGHGLVFITGAHGRLSPIYAVRLDAVGDITLSANADSDEFIAWSVRNRGAYIPTPLIYGDYLYLCRDTGTLVCYEAQSGKRLYQERLGSGMTAFSASLVAGDGKIYATGEEGDIFVVRAGPEFELLAHNEMGEVCMATPAISEGTLFFRTRHHLVAIAAREPKSKG